MSDSTLPGSGDVPTVLVQEGAHRGQEAAGIAVVIRSAIDRDLKAHFAARVKDLRARLRLSQDEFARDYSLNKKTVQGWELGKKVPDHGNRLLIRMIETDPAAVRRLINGG